MNGILPDKDKHPCFNKGASKTYGRLHLPVAPTCNVQCNFCSREYDCINESRPGVCSDLLSPGQALWYFKQMKEKMNISVAGIAGPGDPFANPEPTLETMRLLNEEDPEILLCVSTNGLNLLPYVKDLAGLNVSHVTITINAIETDISRQIYSWIRAGKRVLRGLEGAAVLMENQLTALSLMKQHGITVKINTIVIPGINDKHVEDIAKEVAMRGADVQNCIPLIPVQGTPFGDLIEPAHNMMSGIKAAAEEYLPQMKHCQRCRADAAGLLSEKDPSAWQGLLSEASRKPLNPDQDRSLLAVTSREGLLVNQHLGEAREINIYKSSSDGTIELLERRPAPMQGTGNKRWEELSQILSDCSALFTNGVGNNPKSILMKSGLKVNILEGFIHEAAERYFKGQSLEKMSCRSQGCGAGCSGDGGGCG